MKSIGFICFLLLVFRVAAQNQALAPRDLDSFLPASVKGYNQSGKPKGKLMRIGTLQYSFAERTLTKGNSKIQILLFDYSEASIMYKQAIKKFESFTQQETDSLVLKPIPLTNGVGWEKYSSRNTSTQVVAGINDRFYLTLEGNNVPITELKMIMARIPLESFPK